MKDRNVPIRVVLGTAAAVGLYLISRDTYLLFHVLAELFSIVVAWTVFVIFWNTREIEESTYFLLIGIAVLFVGFLDLIHMLAYEGMGVIPGYGTDTPAQLWIAARSMQAATMVVAPFFIARKIPARLVFTVYLAVTALLLGSIFVWRDFPVCFVDGVGLTTFKKSAEYVICLLFLASIFLLMNKRRFFDADVLSSLNFSIGTAVASELFFIIYTDPYGPANTIGHLLKIASFYCMYRAIVRSTLTEPYAVLFRDLKQNQETQRTLLNVTTNRAVLMSTNGNIIALNNRAAADFGSTPSDLIEKSIYGLLTPGLSASIRSGAEAAVRTREPERFEEEVDGRCFDIRIYPVLDSEGAVTRLALYNEEITERKKMERELIRLSITDNLTGLFNQRHFTEKIREEVDRARRSRHPLCLAIFDVDGFKRYNDLHGHLKGDRILRTIGGITLRSIRNGVDGGFRYGGDEFALILPYADPVMAENIVKRISIKVTEKTRGVTITYGIADLRDDISIDGLITSADDKMYEKKNEMRQKKTVGQ
jgi:diguanylate cyclase (GGDEF)-like protein/PAS domain S-box-containing protein